MTFRRARSAAVDYYRQRTASIRLCR